MTRAARVPPFPGSTPSADAGDAGVVYVEFLLAFFPVFLVFLGTVQLALVGAARLVVAHAAVAAARSAAVVLDDDPTYYGGEARGHLATTDAASRSSAAAPNGDAPNILSSLADVTATPTRLDVIRRAAAAPLAALAPDPAEFARWLTVGKNPSVGLAVGSSPLGRLILGTTVYPRAALAVTFPVMPGSAELVTDNAASDRITVRVTYLFHCAVPIVAKLVCDDLLPLLHEKGDTQNQLAQVPSPPLTELFALLGGRFKVLVGEATSLRRRAAYEAP